MDTLCAIRQRPPSKTSIERAQATRPDFTPARRSSAPWNRIGSVAPGKQADLVLLDGDLNKDITVIENPEIVFKNGVGYDSNAIYEASTGKLDCSND